MSLPEFQSTKAELYLAKIAGETVTLPETQDERWELFLAKVAGEDVTIPTELRSREELFLAKWAGASVNLPGNGLNLADVASGNIKVGKYINSNGRVVSDTSNFYYDPFIPVTPSGTYTMATSELIWYFSVMEYNASGGFLRRDLYGSTNVPVGTSQSFTVGADCASIRFGSNMKKAPVTESDVLAVNWMLTQSDAAVDYQPFVADVRNRIEAYIRYLCKLESTKPENPSNELEVYLDTIPRQT